MTAGFTRTASGRMLPIVFRAMNEILPGSCRDNVWHFLRIAYPMSDGYTAGDTAEIQADGRRKLTGIFAGT
jgi:hypothetical protein